jgi:hypothetical protein
MADVYIMLEQLAYMVNVDNLMINQVRENKINRLKNRLEEKSA